MELKNENVKKAINDIIKKNGFTSYNINVSPGAKEGDNNLGQVLKVAVSGETESGEKKILNLFCKTPVDSESFRNNFRLNVLFKREVYMLEVIIPGYKEFEKENKVADGFNAFGTLAAATTEFEEFILMTDLSAKGFKMLDDKSGFDLEHMLLILNELGKFHALGLAIKNVKPNAYKSYQNSLENFNLSGDKLVITTKFYELLLRSSDINLKFEGKYHMKWQQFRNNFFDYMVQISSGDLAEPFAVINHGDLWNNNILFLYENGIPKKVCFVDWQLSRYTSPALDIAGYIFLHTTKSFRREHYQTLLRTYHNSVSSFLRKFGVDAEKILPFSELLNQLKLFGKYAMIKGIFLPAVHQNQGKCHSFQELIEEPEILADYIREDLNQQMQGVFEDLVDLEYL